MIQAFTFETGGFVLHRIPTNNNGRCSAWFDRDGVVLDAERIDAKGRSMPVKKDGPLWDTIKMYGAIYKGNRGRGQKDSRFQSMN